MRSECGIAEHVELLRRRQDENEALSCVQQETTASFHRNRHLRLRLVAMPLLQKPSQDSNTLAST